MHAFFFFFLFAYAVFFSYLCSRKGQMKRIGYILSVLIVSVLLVCGMLIAALMSDRVETAALRLVAEEFSRALGTRATVGAMEYRFPARVALKDVYIEDRQRDTLLYAGELYVHFRPLALKDNEIRFSHVRVQDVVANLYRLPDSTWNYAFLIPPSGEKKKESSPLQSLISVRDIRLDNIRVRYEDYEAHLDHARMDLHQFSEDKLDAQISELAGTVHRTPGTSSRQTGGVASAEKGYTPHTPHGFSSFSEALAHFCKAGGQLLSWT